MTTNGRRKFRGGTPVVNPIAAGEILLPWHKELLYDICEPARLLVDVRSATFEDTLFLAKTVNYAEDAAAVIAPAPHPCFLGVRSGITFEGPYLCYEPRRYTLPKERGGGPSVAGMWEESDRGFNQFFFDLQHKRPVYFPYPGSIYIMSQYPGVWELNFIILRDAPNRPSPIDSEVTLTMNVARAGGGPPPTSTRTFNAIPPGAHSFTYRDEDAAVATPPSFTFGFETAVKSGGAGPSGPIETFTSPKDVNNIGSAFYTRMGVANATNLTVNACGTHRGILTWHLSFF